MLATSSRSRYTMLALLALAAGSAALQPATTTTLWNSGV